MSDELSRQERRASERAGTFRDTHSSSKVLFAMIGIILLIIVFGAALAFLGQGKAALPVVTNEPKGIDEGVEVLWGDKDAPVQIIEYSDFQCPACRSYSGVLNELKKELGDKFSLVYRHYPLSYHKNSELAARVAEAAARQDKFWEMHDRLFADQDEWSDLDKPQETFIGYARELGLNPNQFKADLNSQLIVAKVKNDQKEAMDLGVPGTPTFFVNGKMVTNPRNKVEFTKLILETAVKNENR